MMRFVLIGLICATVGVAQEGSADRARGLARILNAGGEALKAGQLDEVDRRLAQATSLGPDIRIEILRAELLLARKDPAGAAAGLADSIRSLKPEGEIGRAAHRTHARALVALGNFRDAATVILQSLGLDAAAAPSLALAARGFAEKGDRRTARALLGIAIHLDPRRTDLLKTRASLAIEDGDPRDALREAETLIALDPRDADARILRARALHALGSTMDARDALAALDRVNPLDPVLLRVLANLDLEAGLPADAEVVFHRLGRLGAAEAAALARAWLDRGNPEAAVRVIKSVVDGAQAPALMRLHAWAQLELRDPRRATSLLKMIKDPTIEDEIALARAESLAGDPQSSAKILGSILSRDPGQLAARTELIEVRVLQGDLAAARRLLADGLTLAPHHPAFLRALEDVVPELAPAENAAVAAILHGTTLTVDGSKIDADPAEGLRTLRAMRLALGPKPATVRLILQGSVGASALERAFDLLAAAGFSRISVGTR